MKAKKLFIDTNIILRFLVPEDTKMHHDCNALFLSISKREMNAVTSALILSEVVWTMKSFYKIDRKTIVRNILTLTTYFEVSPDTTDFRKVGELFLLHNCKWIDACIASHPLIVNKKATLVSYDTDFDKLGVRRKEPVDCI